MVMDEDAVSWKEGVDSLADEDFTSESEGDDPTTEYLSLCQYSGQLLHVFQRHREKIVRSLLSKHIVSDRLLSDMQAEQRGNRCSDEDRAEKLLNVVKSVIQADSGKFEAFLEILTHHVPAMAEKLHVHVPYGYGAAVHKQQGAARSVVNSDFLNLTNGCPFRSSKMTIQDLEIKFTPDAQIGSGSFGDVWKGILRGFPCAVKVLQGMDFFLPLQGQVKSEKQKKFESKCKLLQKIKHPNVVQFLQKYIHPESGTPLLAMELMDENLTSFLERQRETSGKRLSECVQVKIGSDVAQALDYLHAIDIVHRNLTSNNILLLDSTAGRVNCHSINAKISDYETSVFLDNDQFDKTLSIGTQLYMPPESWNHGRYNEKLDIFSFGVIIVQTITMLPPNPSDRVNSSNVVVQEVKRREDHLQQIKGHLLQDLAHCCLQDIITTRPSARETCHILQQLTIQCRC